jgi:hypothetical protein
MIAGMGKVQEREEDFAPGERVYEEGERREKQ